MKRIIYSFLMLAVVATLTSAYKFKANDYESATKRITANATTSYEKARAIYAFLAGNMIYDVSGTITEANECWDKSTGTCKAYCDVYMILANHAGLKARVINGIAKNFDGAANESGHKWIAVQTEKGEILCDPVCGSGTVKNGVFTKSDHDMSWWDVAPEVMAITHFPDNSADQLMKKPITREQFNAMPIFEPCLLDFGLNPSNIFNHLLKGGTLPELNKKASGYLDFIDFPASDQLRVGKTYEIKYNNKSGARFILDPQDAVKAAANSKGSTDVLTFTPLNSGDLTLYANLAKDNYVKVATWNVASATNDDYKALQSVDPYLSHAWDKFDKSQVSRLKQHLFNPHELIEKIEKGEITSFPTMYTVANIQMAEMPMTSSLRAGETYTFSINNPKNVEVIVVSNDRLSTKVDNWQKQKGDIYTMKYLVPAVGRVSIFEKRGADWLPVVDYEATEPTASGKALIEDKDPLNADAVKALDQLAVYGLVNHGFDKKELLKLANSGKVTSLPMFYKGGDYTVVDIPLTSTLKVGKSYTFTLLPKSAKTQWAAINGKTQWRKEWKASGGKVSLTVKPENAGEEFMIACLEEGKEQFDVVLIYKVEE